MHETGILQQRAQTIVIEKLYDARLHITITDPVSRGGTAGLGLDLRLARLSMTSSMLSITDSS